MLSVPSEIHLALVLTTRCQLTCEHCFLPSRQLAEMDDAVLDATLALVPKTAALTVFLTGGEIALLSAERLKAICDRIRAAHPTVRLVALTSLIGVSDAFFRLLQQEQIQLDVSFDTESRQINGSHAAFVDAWNQAYIRATTFGFRPKVTVTVTKALDLDALSAVLHRVNAQVLSLDAFLPIGQGARVRDKYLLTRSEFSQRCFDIYEKLHKTMTVEPVESLRQAQFLVDPPSYIVFPSGEILNCQVFLATGQITSAASVTQLTRLDDLLRRPEHLQFFAKLLQSTEHCRTCAYTTTCQRLTSCALVALDSDGECLGRRELRLKLQKLDT